MCGIIGYTGSEDVKGVLLDALELLEYRGYDSAGIAVADTGLKQTKVYKCAGRVKDLRAICESEKLSVELVIPDGQHTAVSMIQTHIRIRLEK